MRQNRANIDPKKFRKHTDIVAVATREVAGVTGDRTATVYGYSILKAECKTFSVLYMSFVDEASTPYWESPKYTRSYTVASGSGYLITKNEQGEEEFKHITNGDTVLASPKTLHRIKSREKLVILCMQEAKYEVNLNETIVDQHVDIDVRDLVSIKEGTIPTHVQRTRNTKTVENMRARQGNERVERTVAPEEAFRATATQGVNARPMTFTEDNAG